MITFDSDSVWELDYASMIVMILSSVVIFQLSFIIYVEMYSVGTKGLMELNFV